MPAAAPASNTSPFRSAEFMAAIALLAVCLAVGGAWWLLSSRDNAIAAPGQAEDAGGPAPLDKSAERAALEGWKQKLQSDFATLDQQRQLQAQRSELDRRKLETDAEAHRLEQLRAEAAAAAAPKPQPVASPAPPLAAPAQVASVSRPEPAPAPVPAHEQIRTEASVDWSSCSRPQYPRVSVDRGEEGIVVLSFKLGANGEVQQGSVKDSSGSPRLDDAALHALQQCRFKPATLDGTAVASNTTVRFQWQLGR